MTEDDLNDWRLERFKRTAVVDSFKQSKSLKSFKPL